MTLDSFSTIVRPVVSEKSTILGEAGKYVFEVAPTANKIQIAHAVDFHLGNSAQIQRASTDANIPISMGREAIAIGAGGNGGGAHTLQEWFDPTGRALGLTRILLIALALAGTER